MENTCRHLKLIKSNIKISVLDEQNIITDIRNFIKSDFINTGLFDKIIKTNSVEKIFELLGVSLKFNLSDYTYELNEIGETIMCEEMEYMFFDNLAKYIQDGTYIELFDIDTNIHFRYIFKDNYCTIEIPRNFWISEEGTNDNFKNMFNNYSEVKNFVSQYNKYINEYSSIENPPMNLTEFYNKLYNNLLTL